MNPLWMIGRAAVLLACAGVALPWLRSAPAAVRRMLLALTFAACLVQPLATGLLPAPTAATPLTVVQAAEPFAEPSTPHATAVPVARASSAASSPLPSLSEALLALWLLGALLAAFRVAAAQYRARGLVRRASRTGLDVAVTDELDLPAVAGLLRPTILLPRAAQSWDRSHLEVALAHERAHIAQRDGLVQLVAQVACALFWVVPWAWPLARRLRRECELAADERVVASGVHPVAYAETLLAVARGALAAPRAGMLGLVSELEERISALCSGPKHAWSRPRRGAMWILLAALSALLACARQVPASDAGRAAEPARLGAPFQRIAEEEAARARAEWSAEDVVVVVLDAARGTLLAQTGRANEARQPGSTIKPFTVATALEMRKVDAEAQLDCGNGTRSYGERALHDAAPYTTLNLTGLLTVSSNVCTSRVYDAVGGAELLRSFARLHLGDAPGARPAALDDGSYDGATVALGSGLRTTALQLAAAYGSLVDGMYRTPSPAGSSAGEPVMSAQTAGRVRTMLESVVYDPRGTGSAAAVPGMRIAGKTGTSVEAREDGTKVTFASFAGLLPAERPRYVVFVGVLSPGEGATGGKVAAPLFARIASRLE